ncbi:hypothetical protein PilKf_01279 [Pillotina sp. SPG140]
MLLRIVAGLYYQETKNIMIDDKQYHNYDTEYRKRVFFLLKTNIIPDHFNSKTFASFIEGLLSVMAGCCIPYYFIAAARS